MSKDNINDIQRLLAKHYAGKRKRLGDSFLAALYNLRLPEGGLSPEDKKRLAYVVWLFYEFSSNNLSEPASYGNNQPSGVSFPDGFSIREDMMGYEQGGENWWNSKDFAALQRNYQHLCGLIESWGLLHYRLETLISF